MIDSIDQRYAIGVFDTPHLYAEAEKGFRRAGFSEANLNLVAGQQVAGQLPGLIETGMDSAAGPVLASPGPLADALQQAARCCSGSTGSVFAQWLLPQHAEFLERQIDAGTLLLWVRLARNDLERPASQILLRHSNLPVHVHDISVQS